MRTSRATGSSCWAPAIPSLPDRACVTRRHSSGPGCDHSPQLDYIPMRLSLVPRLFAISRQPDVVIIHTSPPRDGKVSLGIEVNVLPAALEVARARGALVVAQINRQMPYTFGEGEIATEMIDVAIEVDEALDTTERTCTRRAKSSDRRIHCAPRAGRCDVAARDRRDPRRNPRAGSCNAAG